jgi:hypothetical protein
LLFFFIKAKIGADSGNNVERNNKYSATNIMFSVFSFLQQETIYYSKLIENLANSDANLKQ